MLAFFNTPLGIWLLSSIFVGLGSWAFANWQAHRAEERDRRERVERMSMEAMLRLSQPLVLTRAGNEPDGTLSFGPSATHVFGSPPGGFIAYPELRDRPLSSLLIEMLMLSDNDQDQRCLLDALTLLTVANTTLAKPALNDERAADVAAVKDDLQRFLFHIDAIKQGLPEAAGTGFAEVMPAVAPEESCGARNGVPVILRGDGTVAYESAAVRRAIGMIPAAIPKKSRAENAPANR